MAGRELHLVEIGDIPGRHDEAPRIGITPDFVDHPRDLVARRPVGGLPRAPLLAIDRPQVPARIGPLVPDRDSILFQIGNVGVASEEPQQFMDDGFQMQLLGRDQRKALPEIEAHLVAEDGFRARARPVGLGHALGEDAAEEVLILAHGPLISHRRCERC